MCIVGVKFQRVLSKTSEKIADKQSAPQYAKMKFSAFISICRYLCAILTAQSGPYM